MKDFLNLQEGSLSDLALEMIGAQDAAFILVASDGNIISQTAGAMHLLDQQPLRPVAEVLSDDAARAVSTVLQVGGQAELIEEIDNRLYKVEVRAVPQGAFLYFIEQDDAEARLPHRLAREITDGLSRILAAVHLLKHTNNAKELKIVESVYRSSLRIYRSVSNLKLLQNTTPAEQMLHLKRQDLTALCRNVAESCQKACEQGGRQIRFETKLPERCMAVYDEGLLKRALFNLLTNAIQAEGVQTICIQLTHQQKMFMIYVSDDGVGLSEQKIETICNDWKHINMSGGGFGLPLVRRIAGWHGGTLLLDPLVDTGMRACLVIADDLLEDSMELCQIIPEEGLDITEMELSIL